MRILVLLCVTLTLVNAGVVFTWGDNGDGKSQEFLLSDSSDESMDVSSNVSIVASRPIVSLINDLKMIIESHSIISSNKIPLTS